MAAASAKLLLQAVLVLLLFLVIVISLTWTQHYPLASTSSVSLTTTYSASGYFAELPSARRKLLLSSTTHHQPQPTREFHPNQKINPAASPSTTADRNKAFRAAAHEVPSGPNPESNK